MRCCTKPVPTAKAKPPAEHLRHTEVDAVTSTKVATNGPEAVAGSKPQRAMINGSMAPDTVPQANTHTSVMPLSQGQGAHDESRAKGM